MMHKAFVVLLSLVLAPAFAQVRIPGPGGSASGGGGGGGGITVVAPTSGGWAGHAVDHATTGTANTTGANFMACLVSAYVNGPADAIQDSKGNTWTALTSRVNTSGFDRLTLYYTVPSSVGSGHTVTNNNTGSYSWIACQAF